MGAGELTLGADVRALPHVRTRDPGARVRLRWPRARRRRVLLVGAPDDVHTLHDQVAPGARSGFELAGAIRAGTSRAARPSPHGADGIRWLGALPDLARLARVHRVDEVVVVPGASGRGRLLDAVLRATSRVPRVRVSVAPSLYELRIGRVAARHLGDVPLIDVAHASAASLRVKHVLDHLLATLLLVLALPLLLPAALAVRLSSRGPVLFRQRRVGRDGHEFVIYKLRTMHDDAERATGPVLAHDGDERVTPLRHDLAYVHNLAPGLDLRILAATVRTLAARRGV